MNYLFTSLLFLGVASVIIIVLCEYIERSTKDE